MHHTARASKTKALTWIPQITQMQQQLPHQHIPSFSCHAYQPIWPIVRRLVSVPLTVRGFGLSICLFVFSLVGHRLAFWHYCKMASACYHTLQDSRQLPHSNALSRSHEISHTRSLDFPSANMQGRAHPFYYHR